MADPIQSPEYTQKVVDAMIEALRGATSPEMMQAQLIILRRLALAGDVAPSRVPAPRNITEIGGYLNYLESLREDEMRSQLLSAALGVAGRNPPAGWIGAGPPLTFVERENDRPAGAAQATYLLRVRLRSDFAPALALALETIHASGCTLPLQAAPPPLPPPGDTPAADLLPFVGRLLELAPAAALREPGTDPLALARPAGGGTDEVLARRLDPSAARPVAAADWEAWRCDTLGCQRVTLTGAPLLRITTVLAAAGWVQQAAPPAPTSLVQPGTWGRFVNLTGLVEGRSRFGDELDLLYRREEVGASALDGCRDFLWDGSAFVQT